MTENGVGLRVNVSVHAILLLLYLLSCYHLMQSPMGRLQEPHQPCPQHNLSCPPPCAPFSSPPIPIKNATTRVVMFVPTAVQSSRRRFLVHRQFERENWNESEAILLFVYGTRGVDAGPGSVAAYARAENLFVDCPDYDPTPYDAVESSTTCKVLEAVMAIVRTYDAEYVFRGADDSYINLRFFLSQGHLATIPAKRLYYGEIRGAGPIANDELRAHFNGITQYDPFASGGGYAMSFDVAEHLATQKIRLKTSAPEDVVVGMWMRVVEIDWIHMGERYLLYGFGRALLPGGDYLVVHYMPDHLWDSIDPISGRFAFER